MAPKMSSIIAERPGRDGQCVLVPFDELLFFFVAGAVNRDTVNLRYQPLDPNGNPVPLEPDRVYLRTVDGVYLTRFRSLTELDAQPGRPAPGEAAAPRPSARSRAHTAHAQPPPRAPLTG